MYTLAPDLPRYVRVDDRSRVNEALRLSTFNSHDQSDGMSLRKKSPKMFPNPLFVQINRHFSRRNSSKKIRANYVIFDNLSKEKSAKCAKICPIWSHCSRSFDVTNLHCSTNTSLPLAVPSPTPSPPWRRWRAAALKGPASPSDHFSRILARRKTG
jgi:hypothetical protein